MNTSQQKEIQDNKCGMICIQDDKRSTVHGTTDLKKEYGMEEINSVREGDKEDKQSRWLSTKEKLREKKKNRRSEDSEVVHR